MLVRIIKTRTRDARARADRARTARARAARVSCSLGHSWSDVQYYHKLS